MPAPLVLEVVVVIVLASHDTRVILLVPLVTNHHAVIHVCVVTILKCDNLIVREKVHVVELVTHTHHVVLMHIVLAAVATIRIVVGAVTARLAHTIVLIPADPVAVTPDNATLSSTPTDPTEPVALTPVKSAVVPPITVPTAPVADTPVRATLSVTPTDPTEPVPPTPDSAIEMTKAIEPIAPVAETPVSAF